MKIRVVDFETSDMVKKGRPVDICEFGFTDLVDEARLLPTVSYLVDPGMPISPEARGVHHISDADVAGEMSPAAAREWLMDGMEPGDMFAAHHAAFERELFAGDPFPWICTMVCAKHLMPEAPSYGNQTLRYWLGLDDDFADPKKAMPPHRAGPDTYVTAHLLARLLKLATPTGLVKLTITPFLLEFVEGGKYEGRRWSEMDRGYLEFILNPDKGPFKQEVLDTARHWLNQLNKGVDPFAQGGKW